MNMFEEMIDALEGYFKTTNEEIIVDVLLWLKSNNISKGNRLEYDINMWLKSHHYCIKCGEITKINSWKEARPYQEGVAYEIMNEEVCSKCRCDSDK